MLQQPGAAEVACDNAWADIDVQLKRRYDLIPNLVEPSKATPARKRNSGSGHQRAQSSHDGHQPGDKARRKHAFRRAQELVALSEAYRSSARRELYFAAEFLVANRRPVQNARRYYNAVVRDLNTRSAIPTNIFANMLGFKPREFFEVSAAAEREAPKVSFSAPTA